MKNELHESKDNTNVFILNNSYRVSNSILVTNIVLDSIILYMRTSGLSQWGLKNCKTISVNGRSLKTKLQWPQAKHRQSAIHAETHPVGKSSSPFTPSC